MRLKCSDNQIAYIGMATLGYDPSKISNSAVDDLFKSHYGSCPTMCNIVWNQIISTRKLLPCQKADHLFWTLLFLRTYNTQRVLCTMVKCTRPTFNKHVTHIMRIISELSIVSILSYYVT